MFLPYVDTEERIGVGSGIDFIAIFRFIYERGFGGDWSNLVDTLSFIWNVYSILAIILALIFFAGFVYARLRYYELKHAEHDAIHEAEHEWEHVYGHGSDHKNERWAEVTKHITENSPASWKVALIEADILLEKTLHDAGYVGATISEKLKGANPTAFRTLQDAWEAHKIRNQIAHEGGDFILTKRLAEETYTRYERVFREFGVI